MPNHNKQLLTAEHFYKFFQCPHWIWYDIYADAKKKKQVPPVLELLYKEPELSVQEISEKLKSEFKNISAHINKMAIAGLVMKRSDTNMVRHKLTKRGKSILQFVRIIE